MADFALKQVRLARQAENLDRLVSEFCAAVGEPIPVDAIAAIKRRQVAMRVSSDPERFIYGDADTLAWVREQLERRLAFDEERS